MDLIPGLILFIGAIAIVSVLGFDTFQNRKQITKSKIQQSIGTRPSKQKSLIRTLFKRT